VPSGRNSLQFELIWMTDAAGGVFASPYRLSLNAHFSIEMAPEPQQRWLTSNPVG
jgi:hypothetical protein